MQRQRELFESILCKFIVNLPQEEYEDNNRLGYQAQKAFYYYIDEILKQTQSKDWGKHRNQFFYKLKQYNQTPIKIVPHQLAARLQENKPVCGAIIFNKDNTKVLVIRVRAKFGFPKGKWNQNETPQACAAREVQEQTGIYIHYKIESNIKIEFETHGGSSFFFVARGVGEDERLRRDKKQIDDIFWMRVEDIKTNFMKFVERSKIAWEKYQKLQSSKKYIPIDKIESVQKFISKYNSSPQKGKQQSFLENPFLCFRLNRQRLKQCLLDGLHA